MWEDSKIAAAIGIVLCTVALFILGLYVGYQNGSPINDITEIVWVDSHVKDWGPSLTDGFNLECSLVREEN